MADPKAATPEDGLSHHPTPEEFKRAEERAREAEENMLKAAQFGRDLLNRVKELEAGLETERQERHELILKLETKIGAERALQEELDHHREKVVALEERVAIASRTEKDAADLRRSLEDAKAKDAMAEERIALLEEQLEEANRVAHDVSVHNASALDGGAEDTLAEELANLREEKVTWMTEKQMLQNEILGLKGERDELTRARAEVQGKVYDLEAQLEAKECEVTSYARHLDEAREESQDLQAQIEAMTITTQGPADSKGNSLFSEVEDRRHLVETQMVSLKSKYEDMKVNYDAKVAELRKVKMHNVALLNMAGSGKGDVDQVQRIEAMLTTERNKNKMLTERLTLLQQQSQAGDKVTEVVPSDVKVKIEDSNEIETDIVVQIDFPTPVIKIAANDSMIFFTFAQVKKTQEYNR